MYLTNKATLSGFTLTNGATRATNDYSMYRESGGGGVHCEALQYLDIHQLWCPIASSRAIRVWSPAAVRMGPEFPPPRLLTANCAATPLRLEEVSPKGGPGDV